MTGITKLNLVFHRITYFADFQLHCFELAIRPVKLQHQEKHLQPIKLYYIHKMNML